MKCKVCGQASNPYTGNWAPIKFGGLRATLVKEAAIEYNLELFICLDCGTVRAGSDHLNTNE